ncbi:MAG TPA: cytochrome c peroxidase [Saprospiraceae bacterium]|nr:cytochrome c peroxidase [Saprospiraceae bacterium]
MKTPVSIACLLALAILIANCEKNTVVPNNETLGVTTDAPDYKTASLNISVSGASAANFKNRNQTIHLGRILFYDKALSAGNTVSCASCHRQEFAFSDPFRHSTGIGSQLSTRNTPTIINTAFGSGLFWDQRAKNLMDLVTRPIANHREMGFSNMDELLSKLSTIPYYPELFEKAFGTSEITQKRLSIALALFSSKLNSFDSDLDMFSDGERELTPLEIHGMKLFIDNQCNSCHRVINNGITNSGSINDIGSFSSGGYTGSVGHGDVANIGLNQIYEDNGVGAISGLANDDGQFKIPTLRNIAITPPYMHDGRFATLHEVLDFYSENIRPHANLDARLRGSDGKPLRMHLTETDKEAIIAFMNTLTSWDILTNPLFSNPFE